jgi:hypothetical protein
MLTPVCTFPASVISAAATDPEAQSSLGMNGRAMALAVSMSLPGSILTAPQ